MDEQMIADIANAICTARLTRANPERPDSDDEYALKLARAAHSVIAGKVAERGEALVHIAWLQWKAGEWTAEEALTALFDQIVSPDPPAALAPYPERRSE